MEKRTLLTSLFFAGIIGLFLVFKVDLPSTSPELKSVSISVSRTPLSAPVYVADELALFQVNGLDVRLTEVVGGKKSFEQVMSGQTDFGTSSDSVLMFGGLEGADYINIGSFVQADNDIKLLVREGLHVSSIRELAGKRIGVTKGSASDYFLSLLLALENMQVDDVELIAMSPDKMLDALEQNLVQAVATWEPYVFEIKKHMADKVDVIPTRNIYSLTFNLITKKTKQGLASDTYERFLSALNQAIAFISEHPKQSQDILKKRLGLDQDFISWVWSDYLYKLSLNRSLLLSIENQARWAIDFGLVDSREIPDFNEYINKTPLQKIKKNAVSF